jgi:hypothetical protein
MATLKLTPETITAAVEGFEQQKLRIDAQIAELRQMLTGTPTATAATPEGPRGKRRMSAAARKRIGDAQRKRWAESKKPSSPAAPKPKRRLSAAGKKAIVEATKKRWARVRAEAATAAKAAAKKAPVKASRKAAKKAAVKRPQKAAATPVRATSPTTE